MLRHADAANALFGKSITLAGLGPRKAPAAMRLFAEENPNRPLREDARLVIDELLRRGQSLNRALSASQEPARSTIIAA